MGSYIFLNVYAYIILITMTFLFFSKKRLHAKEDTTYSFLLITLLFTCGWGLLSSLMNNYDWSYKEIFVNFFGRLYLSNLFLVFYGFTIYTIIISNYNFNKRAKPLTYLCYIVSAILLLLPLNIETINNEMIISGVLPKVAYLLYTICYLVMIISVITNKEKSKKMIPVLLIILMGFFTLIFQSQATNINYIINPFIILIVFIMYFTIENPDVKMINALNTAKAAAEKANRAKTEFLSNMSHEIRTPLNAIVGFSDCILEEDTLEATYEDAKDIKLASENLLEIVNGILDISKIEANKMEIVETEWKPSEIFANLAKLVEPRIGEKPIELETNLAEDLPYKLYGDCGKIKQIVTNILTNAAKYTEKGRITFQVNCVNQGDKSRLVISVEDTGRGIKPENIEKLFNKFERLEEDKNTTLEGTGLGLAITKRLTEMLGGKIIVQSKYGEGSKFTVYLEQKIVKGMRDDEATQVLPKVTDELLNMSNKKVLVVDDNKINIKVALKLLSNFGITADSVESGFDCLKKIQEGNIYDLILLDDMMPKMSGVETLKKLQEDPQFKMPVVALTANAISGMKEKYLADGFNDYLAKPIDKNELKRILETYLKDNNG